MSEKDQQNCQRSRARGQSAKEFVETSFNLCKKSTSKFLIALASLQVIPSSSTTPRGTSAISFGGTRAENICKRQILREPQKVIREFASAHAITQLFIFCFQWKFRRLLPVPSPFHSCAS